MGKCYYGDGMTSTITANASAANRSVIADALPGHLVRDVVLVLGYALAISLSAQVAVALPGTPVPVTGQTFAVLVGAAALGCRRALAGSVLYLGGGAMGLPVLALSGGSSLGYVVGFVLAAGVVGWLAERRLDRHPASLLGVLIVGNAIIYAGGIAYLMPYLHVDFASAWRLGVEPFLLGDLVKSLAAVAVLPLAWRALRR